MSLQENVHRALALVVPELRKQLENQAIQTNNSFTLATKRRPAILGLTGLQGSGKSTWATQIVNSLEHDFGLRALQVSLDDFYHTHEKLVRVRNFDATNRLFKTRGQPGTHDEELAKSFFDQCMKNNGEVRIPVFDKSKHDGQGDRLRESEWPIASGEIDVLVFEGWCLGFQPLTGVEIQLKRSAASAARTQPLDSASPDQNFNTLADHQFNHLLQVNSNLARYCATFMGPAHFDCLLHLDTDNLENVYVWRLQQEHALRERTGCGLKDEQVVDFVRGYMPAYELYLDQLRKGFFGPNTDPNGPKSQLRILLGRDRQVLDIRQLAMPS